ncbi:MAG TPA: SHOCT domain-containing protein [Candidatus Limnocylindrales bacterium]|jgi:hypothetical protein|nr:SHOCT domain-containing protein [Candidatus Limnocylindrales bacterium]
MTPFPAADRAQPSLGAVVRFLLGIGGLAFAMTILWLSMRAVMGIGGSCATGGPYVPAVQCPDAVALLTPASIFVGIAALFLALWGGAGLGGRWVGLLFLAWPAMFLSLGWNFLEFGLRPPGGEAGQVVWSWLFCGVLFVLMGGIPLVGALWGIREAVGSHRAYAGGRVLVGPRAGFEALRDLRTALDAGVTARAADRSTAGRLTTGPADGGGTGAGPADDVASRLERLVRLRDAGDLTDAEFDAAKRATLEQG